MNLNLKSQVSNCMNDFNFVVNKVKNDYPGYHDKVNSNNIEELEALTELTKVKINSYQDSCYYYIAEWLDFFKDRHLRLEGDYGIHIKNEIKILVPEAKKLNISREDIELDFKDSYNSDGLEGIWYSKKCGDIAILKDTEDTTKYFGIYLDKTKYAQPNTVFFELTDSLKDIFKVQFYQERLIKNYSNIARRTLSKDILEIDKFGVLARLNLNDDINYRYYHAFCGAYNREMKVPNGYNIYWAARNLSDSTFFLRITNFRDADKVNKILNYYWDDIVSRPNLIIDLRFNSGGQDDAFSKLLDLIYTNPYKKNGVEYYCTEGNIALKQSWLDKGDYGGGEEEKKIIEEHIKIMKDNLGGFAFHPIYGHDRIEKRDTVYPYPKNVGVIVNNGVASSAEEFIIHAKNSKKVTLFGDNTEGVLDYSNTVPVPLPSGKINLRYPMTRSTRLPEYPIDNIGIEPDVRISLPYSWQLFDEPDLWVNIVWYYYELF